MYEESLHPDLVDNLKRCLALEYNLIVHYPRISLMTPSAWAKKRVLALGQMSLKHFEVTAAAIQEMGGELECRPEPFPEGKSLKEILQLQLEKEKLAKWLHSQAANSAPNARLGRKFNQFIDEEQDHINIVEGLLSWMSGAGDKNSWQSLMPAGELHQV